MRSTAWIAIALMLASCDGPDASPCAPAGLPELPDPDQPSELRPSELRLSQLGLYRDIERKVLADDMREFEPAHALWSDGAGKRRWLRLPAGERIDSSDMDHWRFPAGTILFKEFSREGRRIETRVIARTGCADTDTWMGAFVWNEDESDALFAPEGERDARGTRHDVPPAASCATCHDGEPGRVLGFSAVQQPLAPALSHPMPSFAPPGDAVTAAALGYLHANCGHCHNPNGSARPDTDMDLRLSIADRSPADAGAVRTTVGQPLRYYRSSLTSRVVPGDPDRSALLHRMRERGTRSQMPPLASEAVDPAGVAVVQAWIDSL